MLALPEIPCQRQGPLELALHHDKMHTALHAYVSTLSL